MRVQVTVEYGVMSMDRLALARIAGSIEREITFGSQDQELQVEIQNIGGGSFNIIRGGGTNILLSSPSQPVAPVSVQELERRRLLRSTLMSLHRLERQASFRSRLASIRDQDRRSRLANTVGPVRQVRTPVPVGPTARQPTGPTLRWSGFLEWKGTSPTGENLFLSSECRIYQYQSSGLSTMLWPDRLYISFVRMECLASTAGYKAEGSSKLVMIVFNPDEASCSLLNQMGQEYAAMVFGIGTTSDSTSMRMAFFIRNRDSATANTLGNKLVGGIDEDQAGFMGRIQDYKAAHGLQNLMQNPTESLQLYC